MPRTARKGFKMSNNGPSTRRSRTAPANEEPRVAMRLDEAERGARSAPQVREAEHLRRKAEEHARNPNFFEPAEAAEHAARAAMQARQREVGQNATDLDP